jgi:hypothetical protein
MEDSRCGCKAQEQRLVAWFPCNSADSSARRIPASRSTELPRSTSNLSPKPVPTNAVFDDGRGSSGPQISGTAGSRACASVSYAPAATSPGDCRTTRSVTPPSTLPILFDLRSRVERDALVMERARSAMTVRICRRSGRSRPGARPRVARKRARATARRPGRRGGTKHPTSSNGFLGRLTLQKR